MQILYMKEEISYTLFDIMNSFFCYAFANLHTMMKMYISSNTTSAALSFANFRFCCNCVLNNKSFQNQQQNRDGMVLSQAQLDFGSSCLRAYPNELQES